jgi:predicted Zn-dependent protease
VAKTEEALSVLHHACVRDVRNPQLHFQRAHILLATGQEEEALSALLIVKQHAPKEPHVYALLGQVCIVYFCFVIGL